MLRVLEPNESASSYPPLYWSVVTGHGTEVARFANRQDAERFARSREHSVPKSRIPDGPIPDGMEVLSKPGYRPNFCD